MRSYHCDLNPSKLLDVLKDVKFKVDGTGILMANGQWRGVPAWIMNHIDPYVQQLSGQIGPRTLCHVMVNTIVPGGGAPLHVDPTPDGVRFERWHLPLVTNPDAELYVDGEWQHLIYGWWHGPVEYWKEHAVRNRGKLHRTHLVIDVLA